MNIPEDKLLGPYFISKHILTSSEENLTNSFKNKVIMYLFDDAAKLKRHELFNVSSDLMRYSEIIREFDEKGLSIFYNSEELETSIEEFHNRD